MKIENRGEFPLADFGPAIYILVMEMVSVLSTAIGFTSGSLYLADWVFDRLDARRRSEPAKLPRARAVVR